MVYSVEKLRLKCESVKKVVEVDVLVVRDQNRLTLEEAKQHGNSVLFEELEEIPMNLEFSIEDYRGKATIVN